MDKTDDDGADAAPSKSPKGRRPSPSITREQLNAAIAGSRSVRAAARALGVNRETMRRLCRQHGVELAGRPVDAPSAGEFKLPPTDVVPRFSQLPAPPVDDPLAMNAWAHGALGVAFAQTLRDPDLGEQERRKIMCEIAARMSALTPATRLLAAEKMVKGEAEAIANTRGEGPQMEPATHVSQSVSSSDSRPTPRRGRPRKYGFD